MTTNHEVKMQIAAGKRDACPPIPHSHLTPDSCLLTPDSRLLTPASCPLTPASRPLTPDSWLRPLRVSASPRFKSPSRSSASCLLTPDSRLLTPARSAFTLVELLIVIAILAILAAMMLFALAGAEGTAKEMRTRATVNKLHNLIMQKYDSYRTRRAPITVPTTVTQRPLVYATHRLNVLRELMRMEMPDRYTDIIDPPVNSTSSSGGSLISRPSASESYLRIVAASSKTDKFQGAECLYLIVTRGIDDPDVMEQFSPSEIGDADGDGMKEFIDAWENPISFLRWAPGFESALQPKNSSTPIYTEHDPFDPMKVWKPVTDTANPAYWQDFAMSGVHPSLYPLIFSAGPDGTYDVATDLLTPFHYTQTTAAGSPANNPYFPLKENSGAPFLIGSLHDPDADGDNSVDNITNHDLSP